MDRSINMNPWRRFLAARQNDFQNHGSQEASDDQLKTKDKLFLSGDTQKYKLYRIIIDTSVLLENIPLVKFIKATSGTRVGYFP